MTEIEFIKQQLEFLRRDFESLKEEVLLLKKKQTTRKHSFEKSPFFEYSYFYDFLRSKNWHSADIEYYYNSALAYSRANGAKYVDWIQAVQNWRKRDLEKNSPQSKSKFDKINEAL